MSADPAFPYEAYHAWRTASPADGDMPRCRVCRVEFDDHADDHEYEPSREHRGFPDE